MFRRAESDVAGPIPEVRSGKREVRLLVLLAQV